GSSMLELATSVAGVIIFLGLTAYDTAKIKNLAAEYEWNIEGSIAGRIAVIGALELYLDFINLFLYMLRFMGKRKD
ncbi:MAG: Bax inhibitor-1 family protein, partial [Synergistaceae bacterium]|nr:Bax inhibitor-1 family protein [Synergistaceae bacterium]